MNRKLKALSLAISVMALTALMAAPAQAWFTSSDSHTILHGTQVGNHVFTAGEGFGGITCATAEFNGTQTGTESESQEVTPTYGSCKDSFGRTVHVHNNLKYKFTTDGTVHVTGSATLTVTSGGSVVCTVHILAPQTNNGISYHNLAGTAGVTVTTNATNVKSTTTGSFFSCGVTEGEHTEGTYVGHTTVTGKNTANEPVAISTHHPTA